MAVLKIMHMMISKTWRVRSGVRTLVTTSRILSSHYDVLGITPKATQSDIKTAYYKLSKIYHPDISNDETSAKKFRSISEAYEVLGNVRLKKMYDKGLIVGRDNKSRMDYQPDPEPTDPTIKFYKSRTTRHVTPTMDGKTPIYDFDTWSKHHYGNLYTKSQYSKDLLKKKKYKQMEKVRANQQESLIYILMALGGLFIIFVVHGTEDYDRNRLPADRHKQQDPEDKLVDIK